MVFQKKINVEKGEVDLSKTNLQNILKLCLPSEQFVLTEKYWIISGKPIPMQKIWEKFNMSRERIRQILNKSLTKVRRFISQDKELLNLIETTKQLIKKENYLVEEEKLINQLKDAINTNLTYNEILLVLTSDYDLYYLHRNKRFNNVFFTEPVFEDLLNDIHDTAYSILKENKKTLDADVLISKLQSIFLQKFQRNNSVRNLILNNEFLLKIFNLSKYIATLDNKVWLTDNPEVNPKTIKLKIIYVLRKANNPLHYEEITKKIKERFQLKNVKTTTVHNELVKNPEFINVWMWTYWLKAWWYSWDNTLETIKNILKKAQRPMKISEITKEVLKERLIREITVLMVLQKNPHIFKRVSKWTYTLNENN